MYRTTPPTRTRRRTVVAAIFGLLSIVASLAVASPALASSADICLEGWSGHTCVTAEATQNGTNFWGYVYDGDADGLYTTRVIVSASLPDGGSYEFSVGAASPENPSVDFSRSIPEQATYVHVWLCLIDHYGQPGCYWTGSGDPRF